MFCFYRSRCFASYAVDVLSSILHPILSIFLYHHAWSHVTPRGRSSMSLNTSHDDEGVLLVVSPWLPIPLNTSHDEKDVLFVVSPWSPVTRPLEEHTSHDNNDVLLVDFVVWPCLCRWCCCSYQMQWATACVNHCFAGVATQDEWRHTSGKELNLEYRFLNV